MSLLDRVFPPGSRPDVRKTLIVNAVRLVCSGLVWAIIGLLLGGPVLGLAIQPLGWQFIGLIAFAASKLRVPFAGLIDMFARVILMAGDPLLKQALARGESWLGESLGISWFNFDLLILVSRDGITDMDDIRDNATREALDGGRRAAGAAVDMFKNRKGGNQDGA